MVDPNDPVLAGYQWCPAADRVNFHGPACQQARPHEKLGKLEDIQPGGLGDRSCDDRHDARLRRDQSTRVLNGKMYI